MLEESVCYNCRLCCNMSDRISGPTVFIIIITSLSPTVGRLEGVVKRAHFYTINITVVGWWWGGWEEAGSKCISMDGTQQQGYSKIID